MPDEINVRPKSEIEPTAVAAPANQTVNLARTQLTNLCAAGLAACFFLPWATILFGATVSGFDLQKDGGGELLLWFIPVCCTITIIAGFARAGQHIIARITGVLPFAVGIYWYIEAGNDLFHILAYGAYLSLILGAALLVLARKST